MQVDDRLTGAPPEFTCTGAEQIPDATEVMDFTTIRNIDHIELLKLFPGNPGNDSLARAVMEASGYTIDNCPENMLHLSYGLEPEAVPLEVRNATTIVELSKALAEMPTACIGSLVVYCDWPGATIHVASRKQCNQPIPPRGYKKQHPDGVIYTLGGLIETSAQVSKAADQTMSEVSCMATSEAVVMLVKFDPDNSQRTPFSSSLLLFSNGALGPLVDVRSHVNVVPSVI